MATLSVVINAQNVASKLAGAIASVKNFADEIVVVDQESTDRTGEIAKKMGAKVFTYKKVEYVELARNFAISKATNPWILILDPDEEVPASLAKKIQEIIKNPKADYYRIPRKNIIFGHFMQHSRWWPDYNIRLFKKGHVSWNEILHAVPITQGVSDELPGEEKYALVHHHYDSLEEFIERMNRYTSVQAKLRVKENYKFLWSDLLVRPSQEFFSRYFFGEGYKDGIHGIALSLLQAFSELVLYLKIWQSDKFKSGDVSVKQVIDLMRDEEKEFHYWQNDALFKDSGKFVDRLKRKLRI